jgi:hypothetical protein
MRKSGVEYTHGDDATNIAEVSLFFDEDDTKFLRTFPKWLVGFKNLTKVTIALLLYQPRIKNGLLSSMLDFVNKKALIGKVILGATANFILRLRCGRGR